MFQLNQNLTKNVFYLNYKINIFFIHRPKEIQKRKSHISTSKVLAFSVAVVFWNRYVAIVYPFALRYIERIQIWALGSILYFVSRMLITPSMLKCKLQGKHIYTYSSAIIFIPLLIHITSRNFLMMNKHTPRSTKARV